MVLSKLYNHPAGMDELVFLRQGLLKLSHFLEQHLSVVKDYLLDYVLLFKFPCNNNVPSQHIFQKINGCYEKKRKFPKPSSPHLASSIDERQPQSSLYMKNHVESL